MTSLGGQVLLLPSAAGPFLRALLRAVLLLLGHRYPRVRKAAADALYVHFLTYGDPLEGGEVAEGGGGGVGGDGGGNGEGEARLVEVERLLTGTAWLADLEAAVRPAQARLLLLFGLDPPRAGERQPGERAARAAPEPEEEDSYAALVKELGY